MRSLGLKPTSAEIQSLLRTTGDGDDEVRLGQHPWGFMINSAVRAEAPPGRCMAPEHRVWRPQGPNARHVRLGLRP